MYADYKQFVDSIYNKPKEVRTVNVKIIRISPFAHKAEFDHIKISAFTLEQYKQRKANKPKGMWE